MQVSRLPPRTLERTVLFALLRILSRHCFARVPRSLFSKPTLTVTSLGEWNLCRLRLPEHMKAPQTSQILCNSYEKEDSTGTRREKNIDRLQPNTHQIEFQVTYEERNAMSRVSDKYNHSRRHKEGELGTHCCVCRSCLDTSAILRMLIWIGIVLARLRLTETNI